MITEDLYRKAVEMIRMAHSKDIHQEEENGKVYPAEILYSNRMLETLEIYIPGSSLELKLAAQCQHLQRWNVLRSDYTYDRKGYHQWRRAVMEYQVQITNKILSEAEIDKNDILFITEVLKNQGNKSNLNAQIILDTACLVFLKWYLVNFSVKHEQAKVADILKKTVKKMSEKGLSQIKSIDLSASALNILSLIN